MKEEFLHYIWKYKLIKSSHFKTECQKDIEIINQGTHNQDSGPDFFNAKIKINNTLWVGNVEIHINSSDWYSHKHHENKAYDNVILQVVYNHDKEIYRSNGQIIPTIEITFDQNVLENYDSLLLNESWIPCQEKLHKVDLFTIQNWLEKLTIERLEEKLNKIDQIFKKSKNCWETSFYILLARNFGFKLNADPFEHLARSLPLKYLAKHKDSLFQIEALFFGQAGFLNSESGDEYFERLKKEYSYLKKKFELKPIEKHLWKFLRSRPGNFPTIRIAQFASLVHSSSSLFSKILETKDIDDFYKLFRLKISSYWNNHYLFNKESVLKTKTIGKSAVDILLINTIIPLLFNYGKVKGLNELQERSIDLLSKIKPENNSVTSKWYTLGIKTSNAFESQALIQLKNEYCNHKKCLHCQIGNFLIRKK